MQITNYLHTAVIVSDLAKAEHFYGTVLGLPKVERSLRFLGAWYQIGDYQIHLIADTPIDAKHQVPEKWGRDRHLAFAVADLEVAKLHLQAHKCPIQISASGRAAIFTQDPDGNVIELSAV